MGGKHRDKRPRVALPVHRGASNLCAETVEVVAGCYRFTLDTGLLPDVQLLRLRDALDALHRDYCQDQVARAVAVCDLMLRDREVNRHPA
jgi:hypothetical protein